MTNNELLLNISDLLDKKISPIYDKLEKVESRMDNFESRMDNFADILNNQIFPNIKLINLKLENDILPRLQTIEDCYLSTYKRYPLSEGMRPAEVCGCMISPISSRSAISLRMVALLRFRSVYLEIVRLPTGSPVSR